MGTRDKKDRRKKQELARRRYVVRAEPGQFMRIDEVVSPSFDELLAAAKTPEERAAIVAERIAPTETLWTIRGAGAGWTRVEWFEGGPVFVRGPDVDDGPST